MLENLYDVKHIDIRIALKKYNSGVDISVKTNDIGNPTNSELATFLEHIAKNIRAKDDSQSK